MDTEKIVSVSEPVSVLKFLSKTDGVLKKLNSHHRHKDKIFGAGKGPATTKCKARRRVEY